MRISSDRISFIGDRPVNEDCVNTVSRDGTHCFVLCDGLGGHARGEAASACVCGAMEDAFLAGGDRPLRERISSAVEESQGALLRLQQEQNAVNGMKTTLCCLMLSESGDGVAAHVGDSRIYQFRGGKLLGRTLDHSVPQMLARTGQISEEEIRGHEDRNRLLRVMGVEWETPQYQIWEAMESPREGDAFLLCSDGFWEWIVEKEMEDCLCGADSPAGWLAKMKERVERAGAGRGMDNYSAIAVYAE